MKEYPNKYPFGEKPEIGEDVFSFPPYYNSWISERAAAVIRTALLEEFQRREQGWWLCRRPHFRLGMDRDDNVSVYITTQDVVEARGKESSSFGRSHLSGGCQGQQLNEHISCVLQLSDENRRGEKHARWDIYVDIGLWEGKQPNAYPGVIWGRAQVYIHPPKAA